MTVELAELTQWRHSVDARLARLEALYFTRSERAATCDCQGAVLCDHTAWLIRLGADVTEVLAGVRTVVTLLGQGRDGCGERQPS